MSLFLHTIPEWLELVSLACCVGGVACSLWVLGLPRDEAVTQGVVRSVWRLVAVSASGLVVSSVLGLLVRAAEMSGYAITRVLPVVPTVILRTRVGHAWIIRSCGGLVLAATALAAVRSAPSRLRQRVMLASGVVVAAMNSASGHPSDAGDFSVAEIVDWVHLMAASIWGGGLVVLSTTVVPHLRKQREGGAPRLAAVAARFSTIAAAALAAIVLTATYDACYAGSVEAVTRAAALTRVARLARAAGSLKRTNGGCPGTA